MGQFNGTQVIVWDWESRAHAAILLNAHASISIQTHAVQQSAFSPTTWDMDFPTQGMFPEPPNAHVRDSILYSENEMPCNFQFVVM